MRICYELGILLEMRKMVTYELVVMPAFLAYSWGYKGGLALTMELPGNSPVGIRC